MLDIGCGCGATVLELARRVGADGRVLGLDVSEPMSARARDRIAAAGLHQADVVVGDAASHAFPPNGADLLFSRFGVMFFADPAGAFAHLRRAMKPGGRLVFAAWRPMAENTWFSVPVAAASPLLPPQPPADPDAPGPFAFADPARVRSILTQAGWTGIEVERVDVPMRIAGPGEIGSAAGFAMGVGALSRMLTEVDEALHDGIRAALEDVLRSYDGPEGVVLGGAIWLASARCR